MNKFIPIVVEPYPDELLYSWIIRLASINELHNRTFFELYLGEKDVKKRPIKIDIRRGYRNFYKSLNCEKDMMDLYFQTSTTLFELSFVGKRQQIKVLHNILRDEDDLNYISSYFINEPRVCLECMKEDTEEYVEPYFHRSHHLSGVVACHKHHTPLYKLNKRKKGLNKNDVHYYDFENISDKISEITEDDYKYAEYVNVLLSKEIVSNSDDILSVIADKVENLFGQKFQGRNPLIRYLFNLINNKNKSILKRKNDLNTEDLVKCLIKLFPDVYEFIEKIPPYSIITKKYCKKCNSNFYTVPQALKDGWGCPECDIKLGHKKLLERIVKSITDNELKLVEIIDVEYAKKMLLHNKSMNIDVTTSLTNFLYGNTKHYGTMRMTRKEVDIYMKKHKHFQIIEYSGVSHPAKIYHDVCGQTFELSTFGLFVTAPICRCCESLKEFDFDIFKQQVKDLVGDEYDVIDYRRDDSWNTVIVSIRHNKCGTINTYRPCRFLTGERCHSCRLLIRKGYLEKMFEEYSDNRYMVVGNVTKQKVTILDIETNNEITLTLQHIVQEMLRPTPSPIFEFNNKERKQISSWDSWYKLCEEYRKEFGHLCPKRGEWYKGTLFSRWCEDQRKLYNKGELSKEKIQKLNELDFVFNAVFYNWKKRFEEYKAYVEETGITLPSKKTVHNGNKVGQWVNGQRTEKRKGKLNPVYEKLLLEFNQNFFD